MHGEKRINDKNLRKIKVAAWKTKSGARQAGNYEEARQSEKDIKIMKFCIFKYKITGLHRSRANRLYIA